MRASQQSRQPHLLLGINLMTRVSVGRRDHSALPPARACLYKPMFCTLLPEAFDRPGWIFEPKFDGLRILGQFDGKKLGLFSRNQASQNFQFPDIVAQLTRSLTRAAVVDGEVVCFDEDGRTSFRSLQQRFHLTNPHEVELRMKRFPAFIYLFDLLSLDNRDVTGLQLGERKKLLKQAVKWSDRVRWTPSVAEHGRQLLRQACREGNEGVVGKRLNSCYVQGRSSSWVKIKCLGRQEFVIGGFTEPRRSRIGFGALLVGYYSDDGERLIYAGKVGTGYSSEMLRDLRVLLDGLKQTRSPFAGGDLPAGKTSWVRPRLVAEVAFSEWTQNGSLRHPRFEGLRPDKRPAECRREHSTQA